MKMSSRPSWTTEQVVEYFIIRLIGVTVPAADIFLYSLLFLLHISKPPWKRRFLSWGLNQVEWFNALLDHLFEQP